MVATESYFEIVLSRDPFPCRQLLTSCILKIQLRITFRIVSLSFARLEAEEVCHEGDLKSELSGRLDYELSDLQQNVQESAQVTQPV